MSEIVTDIWDEANRCVGLDETSVFEKRLPIQTRMRRNYANNLNDGRAQLHLVDEDGLRRWVYESPVGNDSRRRAHRSAVFTINDILRTFSFPENASDYRGPNQITEALAALDLKLTPNQGLRSWDGTKFVYVDAPSIKGKTLLLIHGTFSNNEMYAKQFAETEMGKVFWEKLQDRYEHILAFDHPTLSVAPWINALDLQKSLRNVEGTIDVLAHSRGGLVISWWLRIAKTNANHVVFVGSPLDGTSLASPYRLRAALDYMATVADLLSVGGESLAAITPIAAGAAGLAKIFGRVLRLGSNLPILDAAIAVVPGLASQQRTNNNFENRCLFSEKWLSNPTYSLVSAHFQPDTSSPIWRVWERLKDIGVQFVVGSAEVIFDGPNDLVVDTAAMSYLGEFQSNGSVETLSLGQGNTHHINYFKNPKVIEFLNEKLSC